MNRKILVIIGGICLLISSILLFRNNIMKDNNSTNNNVIIKNRFDNNLSDKDKVLDYIYSNTVSNDYVDIRKLNSEYDIDNCIKDGCFTIGAMVHNDNIYNDFMNNYFNKVDSFIRIGITTVEGDLIIYDIMYDSDSNKLILVHDSTRDNYSNIDDRIISINSYDYISEYEYRDHLYLVLYNGEINDKIFESNNVFVITIIN